jgi:hypothetical protein
MVKSLVVAVPLALMFAACATSPSVTVVQRADHLSETPSWVSLSNAVTADKQNTYFLGYVELGADVSKSAALNMADQKAYASPMESMVEAYFQQNKVAEDLKKNSAVSELLMSAARNSRPAMPGLRVTKRYWEVVEVKNDKGTEQQLHVFSLAEIPSSEYETAKKEVLSKLGSDSALKRSIDEIAKKQQEQLLNK